MNVLIENYRGFEIIFNTEAERFSFSIDTGNWTEKQSYAACKKNIDDFKKANAEFKPFLVESVYGNGDTIKIVGIRKDNAFVFETKDGGKKQLSEYDEKNYMEITDKNDEVKKQLIKIESDHEILRKQIVELKSKFIVKTLKEIKKNYIKSV